ncbi:MAG: FecCD family ABC transporter permease [Thermodesulfobacteriota bacterium]
MTRVTVYQLAVLCALLLALVCVSATLGYMDISFFEVAGIIRDKLLGLEPGSGGLDETKRVVVLEVRLPRILTAATVGGGLAVAGAVFQGILLNPLADPYTLGVSAGAAFGASLAILFSLGGALYSVPGFAFAGAIATLFLVIYLAYSGGRRGFSSNNLILSGIIVGAILSAGISFLKYLADEQVAVIIFWLMGSFASKTWPELGLVLILTALGSLVCLFYARDLNLIALGSRAAGSLGVNTGRVTLILLITASLIAAVSVSVSGIIGFVGLLVPHMVRFITGPDNRRLIPVSMITGALLLLGADTLIRAVLPGEVPIGVLTALIGGPVFCYIFRKRQMS